MAELSTITDVLPRARRDEHDDWRWQLRHAVRTSAEIERRLVLTDAERLGLSRAQGRGLPFAITPHFLSLLQADDLECPLRRQVIPLDVESELTVGDRPDPLGEEQHAVAPLLIQRYPDRALLLVTDRCASYCRHCTRSRVVGQGSLSADADALDAAFAYLASHPEIREVIVSGGDPLLLSTARIVNILRRLRAIPSIELIRIGTRVLTFLPQRITEELLTALRPYHPLWIMSHFNHPRELAPEAQRACVQLADAGFPIMNHTVLLRGVNDRVETLEHLSRALLRVRVRPYYLLQADPVVGTGHLRTPLRTGIELLEALQGRVTGLGIPRFIVDTPGGFGKVPIGPDWVLARGSGVTRLRTHTGAAVDYWDP